MEKRLTYVTNERGSTLTTTVFFVSLLTLLGMAMVTFVQSSSKLTSSNFQSINSFYSAQSAIEYGVRRSMTTKNWHWSANNQNIAGGSVSIFAEDSTLITALKDTLQIRVIAAAGNAVSRQTFRMRVIDISGYAVYISGNLNDVTVCDSAGNPSPGLGYDYATELPEMDTYAMKQMAIAQGHYFGTSVSLSNGDSYPTGSDASFYHPRPNGVPSDTPNVVYIEGNLEVKNSAQIFGIVVVTGDVVLKNSQKLEGILYLPSPISVVQQVDLNNKESVYGGIFGGTNVEGNGNVNKINVYYRSSYITKFFNNYSANGAPYINIWRNWKQM